MKFAPSLRVKFSRRAFTLAEVLAALLVMAIVIPVAMQGMSIASRAALLGQRKAAAMRVAERMINELFVTGQLNQNTASGSVAEGDTTYPWTMQSTSWPLDAMTEITVTVTFTVQGNNYNISASTLFDPTTLGVTTTKTATTSTAAKTP
jgi:prepilin-type N-terminal cleavage/methylation domain-containing protein